MDKIAIIALLAALSACTPQTQGEMSSADKMPGTLQEQTSVAPAASKGAVPSVLARLPNADGGDGAAQMGTLDVRNGCLVLTNGNSALLIGITNKAITWDGAKLKAQDGRSYSVGDKVSLGGSQQTGGNALPWTNTVPAECLAYPTFITHSVSSG